MLDENLFSGEVSLNSYRADVWRVVESQEHVATLHVVDDLAEQEMLERLLDDVKPRYRAGTEGMHYLLKTAFRYPPLKWGSRFGTTLMPSYFYASEQPKTALCECAYYRFLFLDDMQTPYSAPIRSEYSLFRVLVASERCLDLSLATYKKMRADLRSPTSYQISHQVGQWAYERGEIDLIRFESARDSGGLNVAISEPQSIRSKKPNALQRWLCLTKSDSVSFSSRDAGVSYIFNIADFSDSTGKLRRVG